MDYAKQNKSNYRSNSEPLFPILSPTIKEVDKRKSVDIRTITEQ